MLGIRCLLKDTIIGPLERRWGRVQHWQKHYRDIREIPTVEEAIASLLERWALPEGDDDEEPIFILSAGWRSGSTLLQRLIISGEETLMWGEAYSRCDLIRRLGESLRCFGPEIPPEHFFIEHFERDGGGDADYLGWIACLYPHPEHLIRAHREFFNTLYGRPAHERGFASWGLKEVRLSISDARYLKWLFPKAKFLFLYRNPYAAYRSYKAFGNWYDRWPAGPVFSPRRFGIMWRSLLEGYLEGHTSVGGMMVKYEELCEGGEILVRLSEYLGTHLNETQLARRITGRTGKNGGPLRSAEVRSLRRAVKPLASRLGYMK